MKKYFRTVIISLLLTLTLLLLTQSMAFAAKPLDFHMEVESLISGTGETFYASGPAVDAGIVCPTGVQNIVDFSTHGPPDGDFRILYILKSYTCEDGSGTFYIKMRVNLDLVNGGTTAVWQFTGGDGAYASLHGRGTLVGIPQVPDYSILDIFDGMAH